MSCLFHAFAGSHARVTYATLYATLHATPYATRRLGEAPASGRDDRVTGAHVRRHRGMRRRRPWPAA